MRDTDTARPQIKSTPVTTRSKRTPTTFAAALPHLQKLPFTRGTALADVGMFVCMNIEHTALAFPLRLSISWISSGIFLCPCTGTWKHELLLRFTPRAPKASSGPFEASDCYTATKTKSHLSTNTVVSSLNPVHLVSLHGCYVPAHSTERKLLGLHFLPLLQSVINKFHTQHSLQHQKEKIWSWH